MVKIKIRNKEYNLDSLSSLDLKKVEEGKEKEKLTDYDYAHFIILYAIKKFNKDVNFTLDEFMEEFQLKGADEKFGEIGEIIGLDFKKGIGESKDGKKQ